MSQKKMPEQTTEQKVQTKYDRKMAERAQAKAKEARQLKIMKLIGIVCCIAVVAAIVIPVVMNSVKKNQVLHDTYVRIGDHEMTKLEYDYYYYTNVNSYLNTYGSLISYIGLDTSVDFDEQQYDETMTWKDYFDRSAVEQATQIYTLLDDAQKNGFTYDATEEYTSYVDSIKEAATESGYSLSDYYKSYFGSYATEANMEGFIRDGLVATAYYDKLVEDQEISEDEVQTYYEENRNSYDQVDYKSKVFETPASEDEDESDVDLQVEEREQQAQELLAAVQNGETVEDFELSEGVKMSSAPSCASEWLFDDARAEGDIEVFTDEYTSDAYVVQFEKKYYDEANDDTISTLLAGQRAGQYVQDLVAQYTVTDVKGELKYLTIPEDTTESESTDAVAEDTDDAEAEADTADPAEDVAEDISDDGADE